MHYDVYFVIMFCQGKIQKNTMYFHNFIVFVIKLCSFFLPIKTLFLVTGFDTKQNLKKYNVLSQISIDSVTGQFFMAKLIKI